MRRLAGKDAIFVYADSARTPMHIAFAGIFDPSTIPDRTGEPGEIYDRFMELMEQRLHLFPPFRQKLVKVPFGLNHPLLIEDPDFDLEYHVRRTALPAPGGARELEAFFSRLMSRPMDMSRPMWEGWIVEGLEGGRWAYVAKTHHVLIDGVGGNEALVNLLDLEPEPRDVEPPEEPWQPEQKPGDVRMIADALVDQVRHSPHLVGTLARTGGALTKFMGAQLRRNDEPGLRVIGPRTFLNGHVGPHRQIALGKVPLPDIKKVKNAAGVKVNDVVLAMVGRGLRKFLRAHDQDPSKSLVAAVPISIRPKGDAGIDNQVAAMTVPFHDDMDDVGEQLQAIAEATRPAKEQLGAVTATVLQDWTEYAPPAVAAQAFRFYAGTTLAARHPPLANVTVSNVPGPPIPIYMAGSLMQGMYPVGPLIPGQAMNLTLVSYQDNMHIGIVADRELVPPVTELMEHLESSLADLVAGLT